MCLRQLSTAHCTRVPRDTGIVSVIGVDGQRTTYAILGMSLFARATRFSQAVLRVPFSLDFCFLGLRYQSIQHHPLLYYLVPRASTATLPAY